MAEKNILVECVEMFLKDFPSHNDFHSSSQFWEDINFFLLTSRLWGLFQGQV